MTTEVLRNMIYEDSDALAGLRYVVLDEVHYLQDRYRGAVWEEILIHLPVDVQMISLSATVSNAEEFAEWLQTLRGRTEVIIEEQRPVQLRHWYFASTELLPMFVERGGHVAPNPRGREFDARKRRSAGPRPGPGGRRAGGKRMRIPYRIDVVDKLNAEGMLPAIYFIFSRRGCDDAVKQCLREGARLTTPEERAEIVEYVEAKVADLSPLDLEILGYDDFLTGLERGISAHHAGMIPPFKEIVEVLFGRGLVKVVFATETLALGINMPAKTVVIESLMKFTGEKHELMTPGEFTQLSGRAGRRGMDEIGHAVVLLQRFTPFDAITRLASTRTYPLRSSFQPSYNMAVNLVRSYDLAEAEHLVNSSFAQFQTDRGVVKLERTREELDAYLASYREKMTCEKGDVAEYRELQSRLQKIERRGGGSRSRSKRVSDSVAALAPGDIVDVRAGKRSGRYAVLEVLQRKSERRPRLLLLNPEGSLLRFGPSDLAEPPLKLGRLHVAARHRISEPETRAQLAAQLRSFEVPGEEDAGDASDPFADEAKVLAAALERHPVRKCPELGRHIHFAERAVRLEREIRQIERRIDRTSGTLARRFDQVLGVLEKMGYVSDWELTEKGATLRRIYNESDLLVVELVRQNALDDLEPAELAAVCSTLVYETRGPDAPVDPSMPTRASDKVWKQLMRLWREVRAEEEGRQLDLTREPDPGFALRAYRWAAGHELDEVIGPEDAPGDFVRSVKQLVDLLRQIEEIAPDAADDGMSLRDTVRKAIAGIDRGVIAYSSLEV
jgi:ATP-dependent RNA helicase HelY